MDVTMPQLGETVTEGTITRWFKQVGESIAVDEPLFEVSTDKVDSEVPSPVAGVLTEILVAEGDTVDVGTRLAVIGDSRSGPSPATGTPATEVPVATATAPAAPVAAAPEISPAPVPMAWRSARHRSAPERIAPLPAQSSQSRQARHPLVALRSRASSAPQPAAA